LAWYFIKYKAGFCVGISNGKLDLSSKT